MSRSYVDRVRHSSVRFITMINDLLLKWNDDIRNHMSLIFDIRPCFMNCMLKYTSYKSHVPYYGPVNGLYRIYERLLSII